MTHLFRFDQRDATGRAWCECGLPKTNRTHRLPELSEEIAAEEARRCGETENESDDD